MKCHNCQRTVTKKSKFCPNCGQPIVPRRSQKSQQRASKPSPGYAVGLVGVGLLIGLLVVVLLDNQRNPGLESVQIQNAGSLQQARVLEIAREFHCFCGTCDHRLDECDCEHKNGAQEVKGFIAQKLLEGHKKPHIMEMVTTRYAGSD